VTLVPVLPEVGDPDNRLVEIHFPAAPTPVPQVETNGEGGAAR
jgi:hypothetical protein